MERLSHYEHMIDELRKVIESVSGSYAEARYQLRRTTEIILAKGDLEEVNALEISGVGIRVLKKGSWGFASTNSAEMTRMIDAARRAEKMAELTAQRRKSQIEGLADAKLAAGRYAVKPRQPLEDISIEEKMATVIETERAMRDFSNDIVSARCSYIEIIDKKSYVNTDGGWFELYDSKPEFRTTAICMSGGEAVVGVENAGVTGGWKDLFSKKDHLGMAESAAQKALRLLSARHIKGGRKKVILDPGLVGLISHEAIGHTVEADFVQSGSIARGMLGKKVASESVTMIDSGFSEHIPGAAGTLPVDDEGVISRKIEVIKNGVLVGYLHDRESAAIFGAKPTGNARAFEHSNEPIIRMRNTYIEPGDWRLEELIQETKHGFLMKGALNGEADANAEFMFAVQEAREITNGELGELYRGVTVGGSAFEVLSGVTAITREFEWDMGSGYCGKGQWAKVDGGGGYLRCKALVGGKQSV